MSSTRQHWLRAIKSPGYPAELRSIRATLICLADVMTPAGVLVTGIDRLQGATGLPPRTIERHLARAVAAGWLSHDVRGGHGRHGRYSATVPEGCAPIVADNVRELSATYSCTTQPELSATWRRTQEDIGERSEHGALDGHRFRRPEHGGGRVGSPGERAGQDSIDGRQLQVWPAAAADSGKRESQSSSSAGQKALSSVAELPSQASELPTVRTEIPTHTAARAAS